MQKLLVSDYDNTFYINDEDIEKNRKEVQEFINKGNIFCIATGRSFWDLKKKIDLYKFEYNYLILNHGATIIDFNDNIISNYPIEDDIIMKIYEILSLEKIDKEFFCSGLESRVDKSHKNLTKIYARYETKEKCIETIKKLKEEFEDYINVYMVSKTSLEIISNKTDKSSAIKELLEILKISKENVYTIGDGYSDIKMIEDFNGYCMENSVDELRKICKDRVKSSVSQLILDIKE